MPVEDEREKARQERVAADDELNASEEAELKSLFQRSLRAKFTALAEGDTLKPAQRRKLVDHLEDIVIVSESAQQVSAGFAHSWEVFKSRLPYRALPWGAKAFGLAGFMFALATGYAHTPTDFVKSISDKDVPLTWAVAGQDYSGVLHAHRMYGRINVSGEWSELREWVPTQGYRYLWVLTSSLTPITDAQ
jgi:hypothetical protein